MRQTRQYLPVLLFFLLLSKWLLAQAGFHLRVQADGKTYTAHVRPQQDWLPPLDHLVHRAKVTIVVPAGGVEVVNLESHFGQWQLTTVLTQPLENAGADYFIFEMIGTAAGSGFTAGVEVPLFSFENARPCPGAFSLMDMTDDPLVSVAATGQSFVVEGAGGEAYSGNYNEGQADCMTHWPTPVEFQLQLQPSGYYQVHLLTTDSLHIQSLKVALKVPTNFFQLYDLTNLQSGQLTFAGVMRFDAPVEAPGFDYLIINMVGIGGQPLYAGAGANLPLLRFGNGGSCQGDSIFLVKNTDDPFLPPNSQNADVRQQVVLENSPFAQPVGTAGTASAPCLGCAFTNGVLNVSEILASGPVLCLGQTNGSIQIFAEGADSLQYSVDGGINWQPSPVFDSLPTGTYQPVVSGTHLGCAVAMAAPPVGLEEKTEIDLEIAVVAKACEGDDVALRIATPANLPAGTAYTWSGPAGLQSSHPNPVLFDVNIFHSGTYSLTVEVAGCEVATATAPLEVVEPAGVPTLLTNTPVCDGDPLVLATDIDAIKYEWIGPAGQSSATLALPGLTTQSDTTILPKSHPAYLSGNWKVRLTDVNGCVIESPMHQVEIKQRPQAMATNNGPVCPGKDAQLAAPVLPGAVYRWRRAGETTVFSFDPQPLLSNVTSQTTFELEMELNGCPSAHTAATTVALHPKPAAFPLFEYQLAADCAPEDIQLKANASGMGLTWEWSGVNGFSSQVENPVIVNANAQSNGSYQLKVTNVHGCTAVSPFEITGVVDAIVAPDIQSTAAVCPGDNRVLSVAPYQQPQVSYQWYKDDDPIAGANSSQLHLDAMQPADEGLYRVEVQVDACQVTSADLPVEVLAVPAAQPDFVLTFPCEGSTLQFLSNTNGIAAWEWTGPNGFSSLAQNPVIYNTEFNDVGTYTLTVTADNGCTASGSVIVDGILPVPDAPMVATNSPVCPEDDIVLVVQNPTLLGTVHYEWVNGLGAPVGNGSETLQLPTTNPEAIPPFLVKKNVNGCESELSDPIHVDIKPMPVADAENSGAVCPGGQVQLFAAPATGASYFWREAGHAQVVSFEQNPSLPVYDTTEFELTVQTNGCQAIAVDTTIVFTRPQPVVANLTGGGSHCGGTSVVLSGVNVAPALTDNLLYTWTGPNGFQFSSTAGPADTFTLDLGLLEAQNAGAYTLQLESAEGCLSQPGSVVIDYVEVPPPPVLVASGSLLCEGETLQLDATGYPGNSVSYQWYFNNGTNEILIATTTMPTLILDNVAPAQSGVYLVKTKVDGCISPPSNGEQVTVAGIASNVVATNPTSIDEPVCEGGEVPLEATLFPGAVYHWFGPSGFEATGTAPVLSDVDMNAAGNYLVEINLPGCTHPLTATTTVFVKPKPAPPTLSGPAEVCAGTDATIEASNAGPGAVYHFYFTQNNTLVETGTTPSFTLSQILEGQSGSYYAVVEKNGCRSEESAPFDLVVTPREVVQAYAGEAQTICDENSLVSLSGNTPTTGTGLWQSLNGAIVEQPNQTTTTAHSLTPGPNLFIWQIAQPLCQYISTDTTVIYYEKIKAYPDSATLALTDTLVTLHLLENDEIAANAWDVHLDSPPQKGMVEVDADGKATYRPYPNVFGEDEFTYEICSMTCPNVCQTAPVGLLIENTGDGASDCFVPNLISPNGDGENDVFIVPCAAVFRGSQLVVFNRYGAPVFQSPDYQNDWGGTYKGNPLPAGTYFYRLSLKDEKQTTLQGFITIVRE